MFGLKWRKCKEKQVNEPIDHTNFSKVIVMADFGLIIFTNHFLTKQKYLVYCIM